MKHFSPAAVIHMHAIQPQQLVFFGAMNIFRAFKFQPPDFEVEFSLAASAGEMINSAKGFSIKQ